jgi:hypothetical protein
MWIHILDGWTAEQIWIISWSQLLSSSTTEKVIRALPCLTITSRCSFKCCILSWSTYNAFRLIFYAQQQILIIMRITRPRSLVHEFLHGREILSMPLDSILVEIMIFFFALHAYRTNLTLAWTITICAFVSGGPKYEAASTFNPLL